MWDAVRAVDQEVVRLARLRRRTVIAAAQESSPSGSRPSVSTVNEMRDR